MFHNDVLVLEKMRSWCGRKWQTVQTGSEVLRCNACADVQSAGVWETKCNCFDVITFHIMVQRLQTCVLVHLFLNIRPYFFIYAF